MKTVKFGICTYSQLDFPAALSFFLVNTLERLTERQGTKQSCYGRHTGETEMWCYRSHTGEICCSTQSSVSFSDTYLVWLANNLHRFTFLRRF